MVRSLHRLGTGLSDQAYVELVRSLFALPLPSVVMSALFIGVAALAVQATDDAALLAIAIAGTLASIVRLAVLFDCRRRGVDAAVRDRPSARRQERRLGAAYLVFAALLGLFASRVLLLGEAGLHMVVAALVVGYAAGAAASVALRPQLCAASMALAVVPPSLVCLIYAQPYHVTVAIVLLALLAGGLQSVVVRYRTEVDKIELRRTITGLARLDYLTGLPNRLGVAERFAEATAAHAADCLVAVHCLDLDRFKPVNDRYGHLVGDALLRAVADRLRDNLRAGDVAGRLGGDEFVVLQCGMRDRDEADLLARRLVRAIAEPYRIGDHQISIGVSVGYVVSHGDETLEDLLGPADNALYAIKSVGGGAAGHSDRRIDKATVAADLPVAPPQRAAVAT